MKHFARVWLLMVLALLGAGLIGISAQWMSEVTPLGLSASDYGLVAHALGGKLLTLSVAVLFFGVLVAGVFMLSAAALIILDLLGDLK